MQSLAPIDRSLEVSDTDEAEDSRQSQLQSLKVFYTPRSASVRCGSSTRQSTLLRMKR